MPLYNPPPAAGGGGGIVSVDGDGFTVVAGAAGYPFKDIEEVFADEGFVRIHHVIKHPTLGEITVAYTDVPTP